MNEPMLIARYLALAVTLVAALHQNPVALNAQSHGDAADSPADALDDWSFPEEASSSEILAAADDWMKRIALDESEDKTTAKITSAALDDVEEASPSQVLAAGKSDTKLEEAAEAYAAAEIPSATLDEAEQVLAAASADAKLEEADMEAYTAAEIPTAELDEPVLDEAEEASPSQALAAASTDVKFEDAEEAIATANTDAAVGANATADANATPDEAKALAAASTNAEADANVTPDKADEASPSQVLAAAKAKKAKEAEEAMRIDEAKRSVDLAAENLTAEDCHVPPGQLLFLHVMKNGGTSVDSYLACYCKRVGCSMRLSLGPLSLTHGNRQCKEESVCSTHGKYKDREELCGSNFAKPAKVFTVLRDPIDRVWSLYNYEKAKGHEVPSLQKIYESCDAGEAKGWLCLTMVNHLTLQTFGTEDNQFTAQHNYTLLLEAKTTLSNLDAIFYMEDFDHFVDAFKASELLTQNFTKNAMSKSCSLGHSNPTSCETCRDKPTDEEKELIEKHNLMDIELYKFAASLPNRFRGLPEDYVESNAGVALQELKATRIRTHLRH